MNLNQALIRVSEVMGQEVRVEWSGAKGLWRVYVPGGVPFNPSEANQGVSAATPASALRGFVEAVAQYKLDQAVAYISAADQLQKEAADLHDLRAQLG